VLYLWRVWVCYFIYSYKTPRDACYLPKTLKKRLLKPFLAKFWPQFSSFL
jgi:hypothetical protein